MRYVEMTIEEAMKKCKKNAKILVATQDLADDNVDIIFVQKRGSDKEIFANVKTVASLCDDFVEQLRLFTEKQEDLPDIKPYGIQRIVLLRE